MCCNAVICKSIMCRNRSSQAAEFAHLTGLRHSSQPSPACSRYQPLLKTRPRLVIGINSIRSSLKPKYAQYAQS